jgi:non-specific serine/threonine protein kinase
VADRLEGERVLRAVRVELGPVADASLVAEAIAAAVAPGESRRGPALDATVAALSDAPALLVLDNFEHVGSAAADVATLVAACPAVTVLATSRQPLELTFEHVFPLSPLELPAPGERDAARAGRSAAVALFAARAQAHDPSFELTDESAAAVAEICRRLDGLPLAIELVAARVGALPAPALLARWDDAVGLDTRGAHDLPPRQRTLRRALDWSYDLLEAAEQALLRRLAVFPGGVDLGAVEAVCRGDGDVLPELDLEPIPALALLVERSLVERDASAPADPRYSLLGTVRAYLRERLEQTGEDAAAARLMAETCAGLAQSPDQFFGVGGSRESLDRLERNLNNIHAALDVFTRTEPARAVELAANLLGFWRTRRTREGCEWLTRALDAGEGELPAKTRAEGLRTLAFLLVLQGDTRFREYAAASAEAAREAGDPLTLGRALFVAGLAADDDTLARTRYRRSLALSEELGDTFWAASACNNLGEISRRAGDLEEAASYYERAVRLWSEAGDAVGVARVKGNLALTLLARGELGGAEELLLDALETSNALESREIRTATLARLAAVAAERRPSRAAAALFGVALTEIEESGLTLEPLDEQPFRAAESALRDALGAKEYAAAEARGRVLGALEQERLVGRIFRTETAREMDVLTARESEIVQLVAAGLTNAEIAGRLVLSEHTVHRHVANILRKLDAPSRAAAVSRAAQTGLL